MDYERTAAVDALAARGHVPRFGPADLDAEAVLTGGAALLPATFASLPRLALAIRFARGRHDLRSEAAACRAAGVRYRVLGGFSARSTAEHAVMLMLALLKRLPEAAERMNRGEWPQAAMAEKGIRDLGEAVVGLVGMGAVGRQVATLLKAFGSTVLYFKPSRLSRDEERRLGIDFAELDALLERADIVSLHARHAAHDAAILDGPRLDEIRPGCIVINTGHGSDVDLEALYSRVKAGRLLAALDVFASEPWRGAGLDADVRNGLLLTPHIAGRSRGTAKKLFENAATALDELCNEAGGP
jgi:phosphoglycerate dehydrogenase-like enzyme